jgi:hypothetical protein
MGEMVFFYSVTSQQGHRIFKILHRSDCCQIYFYYKGIHVYWEMLENERKKN